MLKHLLKKEFAQDQNRVLNQDVSPMNKGIRLVTTLLAASVLAWPSYGQDSNDTGSDTEAESEQETVSVLPLEDLRVFTKAYAHIRSSYIKEIDDRTLLEYAIRGMLDELDPHSTYLDASSVEDLQVHTTGEFGGLGIEVGMEEGYVRVISPIDNTPADSAGIESGDLIIKLDDTSVKGLTLSQAVEKMRGPKGSDVVLTIVREGVEKPFELTLTRDIIKVRSVRSDLIEEDYAYIRIAQFQTRTGQDLAKELGKLKKLNPNIKGIILDLRNNPGGLLQASVEVADHFLNSGTIVYTEGRFENAHAKYTATEGDISDDLPLIVLINGGSASASEIVAGALQDQRRALILGTQSFGKGSVQTVLTISKDRAVKLTTALYYTPNGRSIQAEGIVPDITVERVRVTAVKPRASVSESDLEGHINNSQDKKKKKSKESASDKYSNLHNDDSQLYEALNVLKGLNFFKTKKTLEESNAVAKTELN